MSRLWTPLYLVLFVVAVPLGFGFPLLAACLMLLSLTIAAWVSLR